LHAYIHAKLNSQSVNKSISYRVCAELYAMFDEYGDQAISE